LPRTATRRTNRFRGTPQRSSRTVRRTPINSPDGGTQIETVTTSRTRRARTVERREPISTGGSQITTESEVQVGQDTGRNKPLRSYSPTRVGDKASGVGLLEAEFLAALFLQILILFADTNKSYADKVMQTMKRGTMIALLFFILALISGVGPNVARVAKAIGGLTVVAILLTSPMTEILGNLDTFFKADWTGTTEHGTDVGQTSTPSSSGGASGALHAAEGAVNRITQIMQSFGFGIIK
jgi:hypothetical protein